MAAAEDACSHIHPPRSGGLPGEVGQSLKCNVPSGITVQCQDLGYRCTGTWVTLFCAPRYRVDGIGSGLISQMKR